MKSARLPLLLTPFSEIEMTNALLLRQFRREVDASTVRLAQALFRQDIERGVFDLKPLPSAVFDRARQLAEKHTPHLGTRTLDVLHVASALVLQADHFYTFDKNQAKLARLEGLTVP
jgi:predicted nucleic acid-binding protein